LVVKTLDSELDPDPQLGKNAGDPDPHFKAMLIIHNPA
jgi:hypothetical protein